MLITKTVLVADKPNKNNRIYPKAVLERTVTEFQETVKNRTAMGMIGYPETDGKIQLNLV